MAGKKATPFIGRGDEAESPLLHARYKASDTTIPGGLYIVNDQVVNANGKPIPGYVVVGGRVVVLPLNEDR
jgi:hypothetical protein